DFGSATVVVDGPSPRVRGEGETGELQAKLTTHKLSASVAARNKRLIGVNLMPGSTGEQTRLQVGVDVGGTFTDLVAFDGQTLRVVKLPSSPPEYERAVIEAVQRAARRDYSIHLVHGSTVATNALLQRKGEEIAFVTT